MPYSPLCHVPPCKINFFYFFLAVVMFPSGFLATNVVYWRMYEVFALKFFFFHLKISIKNKVISININCSYCWPLSCSPYWKMIKSPLFGGNMTKDIMVIETLQDQVNESILPKRLEIQLCINIMESSRRKIASLINLGSNKDYVVRLTKFYNFLNLC